MHRLLFEKKGRAVWISHLDLMRLFQRAFKRAGLALKHTQGFNPRPSVSIALPLSVGIDSVCELLDFEIDGEVPACEQIRDRLNECLVEGVRVVEVYEGGRKIRDLSLLQCTIMLEYDSGTPNDAKERIENLFKSDSLIVPKKTKSGIQDQDIIPMIKELSVCQEDEKHLAINALICCQNPTLNPAQLVMAIGNYLPQLKPDFSRSGRIEIFDSNRNVFR